MLHESGCRCGVDRPRERRTIGLPPGVAAAPILADPRGVRHFAARDVNGAWHTLCGLVVPAGHRCPTEDELSAAGVWVLRSCDRCHHVYLTG